MEIINKYIPDYNEIIYRYGDPFLFINSIAKPHSEYYLCPSPICFRIIFDSKLYIYNLNQKKFPPNSSFLFNAVKKSTLKYLKTNYIPSFKKIPSYYWSGKRETGNKMMGTDINHAYWKIANNIGLITNDLYQVGIDYKETSLSSLAAMGRSKVFIQYRGFDKINYIRTKEDGDLINAYEYVRNTCFSYMEEISGAIPDEFNLWKTDEIQYSNTDYAIDTVHNILSSKNVTFKDRLITT